MPLDVMLKNMRHYDATGETDKAQRCAADAAPYLHPRLSTIDAKVAVKQDVRQMSEVELLAIIAEDERTKSEQIGEPDGTVH